MESRSKTAAETDVELSEALHQMSDEDLRLLACRSKPVLFEKGSLKYRLASWVAAMSPFLAFIILMWMTKDPAAGVVGGVLCFLPAAMWYDAESHWNEWESAAREFHKRIKAKTPQK
jgi:hypothetical protein